MANNYDTVKGVDWREVFPWTALTRAFTVAVSITVLLLASFGVGLTVSGWAIADSFLIPEQLPLAPAGATTAEMESATNRGDTFAQDTALQNAAEAPVIDGSEQIQESAVAVQPPGQFDPAMGPIAEEDTRSVFERLLVGEGLMLVGDLHDMLLGGDRELDAKTSYAICIIDFVWLLVVWGFFGAMITRIAVIRIGRGEKIGLKEAMADVRKKYISYVMSPLFVLVSCFVLSLPIVLISLLLNFDIGVILASVLWIVAIVASIGVAVLLTGFF